MHYVCCSENDLPTVLQASNIFKELLNLVTSPALKRIISYNVIFFSYPLRGRKGKSRFPFRQIFFEDFFQLPFPRADLPPLKQRPVTKTGAQRYASFSLIQIYFQNSSKNPPLSFSNNAPALSNRECKSTHLSLSAKSHTHFFQYLSPKPLNWK